MKITYFTHQYLPRHIGGKEVYTHGLTVRAKRAGDTVRVISHVESRSLNTIDYKTVRTVHTATANAGQANEMISRMLISLAR